MGKIVKKSLDEIKAGLSQVDIERQLLEVQETPEDEGLSSEVLSQFKPAGERFKKLTERPARSQRVTIRFESAVLSFIKQDAERIGKPYQTHINDILRTYVATCPSDEVDLEER